MIATRANSAVRQAEPPQGPQGGDDAHRRRPVLQGLPIKRSTGPAANPFRADASGVPRGALMGRSDAAGRTDHHRCAACAGARRAPAAVRGPRGRLPVRFALRRARGRRDRDLRRARPRRRLPACRRSCWRMFPRARRRARPWAWPPRPHWTAGCAASGCTTVPSARRRPVRSARCWPPPPARSCGLASTAPPRSTACARRCRSWGPTTCSTGCCPGARSARWR